MFFYRLFVKLMQYYLQKYIELRMTMFLQILLQLMYLENGKILNTLCEKLLCLVRSHFEFRIPILKYSIKFIELNWIRISNHGVSYANSLILEYFGISDIFYITFLMYQHMFHKKALRKFWNFDQSRNCSPLTCCCSVKPCNFNPFQTIRFPISP